MDVLNNWAAAFLTAHPHLVVWVTVVLIVDQGLKTLKNALKLNIPDNVFDFVGDTINAILSKVNPPKP